MESSIYKNLDTFNISCNDMYYESCWVFSPSINID